MKKQIWTEEYRINSYFVNLRKRAGLYAILNLVQDVGWQHAMHWGVELGKEFGWVFTRQKLMMSEWPGWNETVRLETWLRPAGNSPFVFRDYELYVKDKKVGECTSTFSVIDMRTRKLAAPDWSPFAKIWREHGLLPHEPAKIALKKDGEELAEFEVRNSDLDLNDHVNNTRYAQWILDAVPVQQLRTVDLHEYEVNFLAETKSGDRITIQRYRDESAFVQFQGLRKADGKVVFSARMRVTGEID